MSNIKAIILTIALVISGSIAGAYMLAPPAHASSCATGNFHMENLNDGAFYLVDEGHNNPIQQRDDGATIYCLVNSGTSGWYEFQDQASLECLNAASNGVIYMDSCIDSSPEQWHQQSSSAHNWENRHFGLNGFMQSLCDANSSVTANSIANLCGTGGNQFNYGWATPTA